MATMSAKNMSVNPAVFDLGLGTSEGAQLQNALANSSDQARARIAQTQNVRNVFSPAGLSLLLNPSTGASSS